MQNCLGTTDKSSQPVDLANLLQGDKHRNISDETLGEKIGAEESEK